MNQSTDPGLIGWIRLYNLTFIVGLAVSFVVFYSLNFFFPPAGLGEEAPFVDSAVFVGEEQSPGKINDEELNYGEEKQPITATASESS